MQFSRIRLSDHLHLKACERSLGLKIQSPLEVSNLVGCFKPHGNHPLLSSLRDLMKAGRLPSAGITRPQQYLCAPPTPRLPDSVFGCPYAQPSRPSPATSEISRVTHNNFPHIPSRRPRKVHLLLFGYLADGCGLPHLTTGSALSMTSYEALWVPWWYGLRVCDPSSKKVFSIHSVLKVASQNRIFASGVYRQFPAPDFNRLVAMLPRHTVRLA
jgi:hypothetical protein